ncbi:nitrite reductase small subunit NirD [Zophobihabitans entericus]|uniref:Nitrite reductase (NADH) small subunit n=1 Tax=Zophobihabitans entericus TaxID=1635327 RepID=A0A6G9I849_9GAMM|nr:nitrite reductase small subunit NirD [Zophobihabitans entericus]QIQ20385.1 nitrite reductase small subunit NirD [Zophobihabitans entericus]
MTQWVTVCQLDDIVPQTGVCALVDDKHIAIFRPRSDDQLYAISNIDPFAQASVLSRGLIAEHQNELWVASPLKKQRFRLKDGYCLEDQSHSVTSYEVRVENGSVQIKSN